MGVQMAMMDTTMSAAGAMPPGCPMRMQVDASASDAGDLQVPAGMEKCTSCQLCIPLAAMAELPPDVSAQAVHAQPLIGGVNFRSVPPALALKPPIS